MSVSNSVSQHRAGAMTARQEQIAELKLHGLTIRQIGVQLGVSHSTVANDLKVILDIWKDRMAQSYEDYVAEKIARYEQLAAKLQAGVDRGDWKAIDTAIRLEDRAAKLLGIDAPVRTEVTITLEAIDAEIARLEAKAGLPVLEGEIVGD